MGHTLPNQAQQVRPHLGYLGHDPLVYLDLTALQNLELFAELYGIADARARVEEMLDHVGLLPRAFEPVRTFSRGMAQRLGIARLLLHRPSLLLLDEPNSGLDASGSALMDQVIAEGSSVVVVTHDVERAVQIADRVMVLRAGTLKLERPTTGLDPAEFRAEYEREVA
jgi:heme exporter protein A